MTSLHKFMLCVALACALFTGSAAAEAPPPWRYTLAALQSLPVHKSDHDEAPADRTARLTRYAQHLHAVTRTRHERGMLIAVATHESHFSRAVCEGRELGDKGKAWGCWQSWEADRSGGVKGQAQRAITHLRKCQNFCRARNKQGNSTLGAFALYATGKSCSHASSSKRLATYRQVMQRL